MVKIYVIKIYASLIRKGIKDINDVPEDIRDLVQKELDNN